MQEVRIVREFGRKVSKVHYAFRRSSSNFSCSWPASHAIPGQRVRRWGGGGRSGRAMFSTSRLGETIPSRLIKLHNGLFDRNRPIELASAVGIDRPERWQTSFPSFWICFTVRLRGDSERVDTLGDEREMERAGGIENERLKGQVSNREAQNVKGTWRRTEEIKEWESSIIWESSGGWWEGKGKRIQKGRRGGKSRLMREGRRKLQNGRIRVSKFRLKGKKYFQDGSVRGL